MIENLLAVWVWLCLLVFTGGCLVRAFKYATAPVHLRWDLYPVAHEPGRDHGGSYLEEKEWWTKKREKDHLAEILAMAAEILLLKGVWENNRRLWWASFPFHWGLYILVGTTVGLTAVMVGLEDSFVTTVLAAGGVIGGALTSLGALALLVMRSIDPKLRPYTTPLDRANLLVLVLFGALTVVVAAGIPGMAGVPAGLLSMLSFGEVTVPVVWALQIAVGALFLFYLPLTRMVHFFAKYFTYHQVRWDDQPIEENPKMASRVQAALGFGVDWSADHIGAGKTWGEVATTIPGSEEGEK
ncbi:MAG: respiratory nitrate reductase subunit gamma [Acidobacteriota bacterium]